MSDYTPTIHDVREAFSAYNTDPSDIDLDDAMGQAFDRFLAAHDAEVAAKALRQYARALDENPHGVPWKKADYLRDVEDWAAAAERGE